MGDCVTVPMEDPAYDLATLLEEDGFGTFGKDIFATVDVPNKPDFITFLTVPSFSEPDDARYGFNYSIIQIVVRGAAGGYVECARRLQAIHEHVHGITNRVINKTRYVFIYSVSPPISLPLDEIMRPYKAATYRVFRQYNTQAFLKFTADQNSSCSGSLYLR